MENFLFDILLIYLVILYCFYFTNTVLNFNNISYKAWASPFKYLYLEILYAIFLPIIFPINSIIYMKNHFNEKVKEAKEHFETEEIKKICNIYNFNIYLKDEKIETYMRKNLHSTNPHVKLLKDYLENKKAPFLVLQAKDIYSFHKHGWY